MILNLKKSQLKQISMNSVFGLWNWTLSWLNCNRCFFALIRVQAMIRMPPASFGGNLGTSAVWSRPVRLKTCWRDCLAIWISSDTESPGGAEERHWTEEGLMLTVTMTLPWMHKQIGFQTYFNQRVPLSRLSYRSKKIEIPEPGVKTS